MVAGTAGAGHRTELEPEEPRLVTPVFGMVMLAAFAYFFALGGLMPIVPRYVDSELGGGGLEVGLAVGAFAVSAAALRPWVGRLGDIRGRRVLVAGGAAIVGVTVLAYPLATSVPAMIGARLLTGVGEAAVFTGAATAAQDLAPDHRRGEAASYFSVALYGGIAVGPLVGEELWRATSFTTVFLFFGMSSLLAAALGLKVPVGHTDRTLSMRATRRNGGPGLLHGSAVFPGMILLLGLIPLTAFVTFLPLYAEDVGMENIGPVMGVYAGSVLVVRIFGAKLPDILGWWRGSLLALTGVLVGAAVLGAWASPVAIWLAALTMAFGMSLLFPALFMAVMGSTPEGERTHAVGTFSLFFDLSQGLGAAFIGGVISLSHSEQGGFLAAAGCAALGLVARQLFAARIRGGMAGAATSPDPASLVGGDAAGQPAPL